MTWILILLILCGAALLYYSWQVEPHRLQITHHTIPSRHPSGKTVRVVQFSDVHIRKGQKEDSLVHLLEKIQSLSPDVVVFTGDFYDNYHRYHNEAKAVRILSRLDVPYAFAVYGNHDYAYDSQQPYQRIMHASPLKLLKNEEFYIEEYDLAVVGLDDAVHGVPRSVAHRHEAHFTLLLGHESDLALRETSIPYDLALCGHSHGGQINLSWLPFYSHLKLPKSHDMKYRAGFYPASNGARMYINRGIGTTHLPLRLGAIPELSVFDIQL